MQNEKASKSTTGTPVHAGLPCANGFTASFALSPETWLCCLRHWHDTKHRRQEAKYFSPADWTTQISLNRLVKISFCAHDIFLALKVVRQARHREIAQLICPSGKSIS
jgi:hypothetical protein